jgi:hypothetical protein
VLSARNKFLQAEMLKEISNMMKIAACMDDGGFVPISALVDQVDELAMFLEGDEDSYISQEPLSGKPIRTTPPHLTVVGTT